MKQQKLSLNVREFRKLLRKFEREFNSQLRQTVDCCGVTVIQCHTLLEIEERGETNMKEIADYFRIDKSTISRTISILVTKGLVLRKENPENRRMMSLKLTKEGLELSNKINMVCDSFYMELMNTVPEGKIDMLFESLQIFVNILKRTGPSIDCKGADEISCFT